MTFRFIHTADWQLGKPFARFDPALSGRLRAERQDVIGRIAAAARTADCQHILVAGDVWDTTLPGRDILLQPLDSLAEHADLIWWLLPGNHDRDDTDGLWDRIEEAKPTHVRLLRQAEPVEMESGVWLLPAPWQRLHHGEDLTRWMETAKTPEGVIRIGLAHGGVRNFGTRLSNADPGETSEIIPPDRAQSAKLDYLALGDWHARTAINARTHYPGTPEPDRFKGGARGQVLCVEIAEAGADPVIHDIPTARFDWAVIQADLTLDQIDTVTAQIRKRLSEGPPERDTLVQLHLGGETTLSEWAALEQFMTNLRDRCAHLDVQGRSNVRLRVMADDMDMLDAQGSVRAAAETLDQMRQDPTLSQTDRERAADALRQLFAFTATDEPA